MKTLEELEIVLDKIKKQDGIHVCDYGDGDPLEPELTKDIFDGPDIHEEYKVDAYTVTFLVKGDVIDIKG